MTRSRGNTSTRHAKRTRNRPTINQAFNDFLRLSDVDKGSLARYRRALKRGAKRFAGDFYDYLLAFPATADVLRKFQKRGGKIDDLVRRQLRYLTELLTGDIGEASAQRLIHVGEIHHRHGVEPAWMLGAYRLYLSHLQALIRTSPKIADAHREALETSTIKFLFRDMGLALDGYWESNVRDLQREKAKVGELQAQVTSLLSNIPQLLWSVDVASNRALYVSPSEDEIRQTDIDLPIPSCGSTIAKDRRKLRLAWESALGGERVDVESRVRQPNGEVRWFRRTFCPFTDAEGKVIRIDGIMEDTTEAKQVLQKLRALATTDPLTGLPNRALFEDRFKQAIHAAARGNREVVLMLIDLDHFKEINDTLGHPAGDQALTLVGQRLSAVLRGTDTLARLGGDEFAILLADVLDGRKTAEKLIKKMLQCFDAPLKLGDNELFLRTGIGVAVYPGHGEDVETLMRKADVAMYGTKNRDVNFLFYNSALDPNASPRLKLSGDLRHAIKRRELLLHYQPQIDIRGRSITGVEALVRWNHPKLGLLGPNKFIPAAERTGSIRTLTYWAMDAALHQCKRWHRLGLPLRVAVNVSARVLRDPAFVDRTRQILRNANVATSFLEIEVTENTLMSESEHVRAVLVQLAQHGVRIAIDDFGTGYSSLASLEKLPVHTLKVDRSFVRSMVADEHAATIVRSTIDLGHNLGCTLVAEGVENRKTWEMLSVLGCDNAQGFLISQPLAPEALSSWLIKSPWNVGSSPAVDGTAETAIAPPFTRGTPDRYHVSAQRSGGRGRGSH